MNVLLPLQHVTLTERVQTSIREAIFRGRFRPGAPLRELTISRELGTSQAVVREALLRLEAEGLVQRITNRGTHVVNLTSVEISERLEVRLLLESQAALAASRRLDAAGWRALDRSVAAIEQAVAGGDSHAIGTADLAFHRAIWNSAGNQTLATTLNNVAVPLFAFADIVRAEIGRTDELVSMHRNLLDALRGGGRRKIETALRDHILPAYQTFLDSGAPDLGAMAARAWNEETTL